MEKLHEKLLEVMDVFHAFCDENGLTYYMLGGTMLGAYRHQGFIPWDDDIDIGMPRADFEKFCKLAEKELAAPLGFISYKNNKEHIYFHPRVYNFNSRVIDRSGVEEKETHAWIDVFPLDGMPGNKFVRKLHGFRLLFLRLLFMYSQFDKIVNVNLKNRVWYERVLISIGKVIKFDKILDTHKIMAKIDRVMQRYDYEKASYVGNFMGAYKLKEVFPKNYYEETAEYEFEGLMCPAPKDYDAVLSQMYGDYMTPPETSVQNKHHTEVLETE